MGKHDRDLALTQGVFRNGKRVPSFTLDRLLEIYCQVQGSIACPPGCNVCCRNSSVEGADVAYGLTEIAEIEDTLLAAYCGYKGYEKRSAGIIVGVCPYIVGAGCQMYPVRPFVCRVFGFVDRHGLRCPIGVIPDRWFDWEKIQALWFEIKNHSGMAFKKPTPAELNEAITKLGG